jgi:hypothetical protein
MCKGAVSYAVLEIKDQKYHTVSSRSPPPPPLNYMHLQWIASMAQERVAGSSPRRSLL